MRNFADHVARVGADDVAAQDLAVSDTDLASYLMFPKVFKVFFELDGQPRTVRVPTGEPQRQLGIARPTELPSPTRFQAFYASGPREVWANRYQFMSIWRRLSFALN